MDLITTSAAVKALPADAPTPPPARRAARFGLAAIAFFTAKGLLWVALPLLAGRACVAGEGTAKPDTPRPADAAGDIRR